MVEADRPWHSFPQHLLDGYRTFTSQRLPTEQSRYRELSERGQSPAVMVIGCCDSRVSPEVIFDAGPGELFVVRNVANLVPVYQPDSGAHGVSAALEYAVNVLRVKHIVVLGHAQCGGIRAFIDKIEPLSPGDFIGKLDGRCSSSRAKWSSSATARPCRISPSGSRRPRCSESSKT